MESYSLGFSESNLKILKLNSSKEIILKDEIELGFSISDDFYLRKSMDEAAGIFSEKISPFKINDDASISSVSVLIETSNTFMNVFPVDFSEDKNIVNSHIMWELSNYFPETYKDYSLKYFRLHNNYFNENTDEVLLIAIEKSKIDFLKILCNSIGIRVKSIGIDQFAAEDCVKYLYPEDYTENNILLTGYKNSRMDFSLISNGKIKYYDFIISDQIDIKTSLAKILGFFGKKFCDINIDKIFLYGEDKSGQLKDFLSDEIKDIPVTLMNPFRNGNLNDNQSSFAPLFGLALKNYT